MGKAFVFVSWIFILFATLCAHRAIGAEDEILAKVGSEVITRSDFEARLKSFPPEAQEALRNPEQKRQVLDSMVKARLLVLEGEIRGLTGEPDVQARLKMLRDDLITQEYARAYLEKKTEVSDEEAERYYNTNLEMKEREYLKVSQIVVEKEEEAKKILENLKKGENFKKLATEKSVDGTSRQRGGELEWFERGKGEKEIEEALRKVEKGGVSDIVNIKGRYSILKLEDRRIVPKPPYLKVKDEIVKKLKYEKVMEQAEKEIEELKKKIKVETFYEKLDSGRK